MKALIGIWLFCLLEPTFAQEIGYLDLTDNLFRESSHPASQLGDLPGDPPQDDPDSEVTVTLLSLDKPRYQLDEEATFEVKVLNSGKKTIVVPWTPHRADVEPADANLPYKYLSGEISLQFYGRKGRPPFSIPVDVFESLYGRQSVAGTVRELMPGQWFTVRGRKKVQASDYKWKLHAFTESGFVETKVTACYFQDIGVYTPNKNGGSDLHDRSRIDCHEANHLDVTLEPPDRR